MTTERKRGRPPSKTVPCYRVWLKSPKRKEVDALVWVPGGGEFCRVPENFGGHKIGYNLWRGLDPLPWPEDWRTRVQPFIDHVKYLVPVVRERITFMQWLAHIVQRPEILPHTYYLMITETHGIGRNLLASILVRVFHGHVAAGITISDLLEERFNGRLSQKLLFIVDELREGSGSQRYQQESRLRAVITQEVRLINPKFGVQTIEKNCCRGLMFSNHHDAIPLDNHDRRAQVIDNPTEPRGEGYYEKLYGLLEDKLFIGSVRRYLETLDIASFKPGAHATMNEAKRRAIESTKDDLDCAIDDFKDTCPNGIGFRGTIDAFVSHASINTNHITNAIARSGMISVSRRIPDGNGRKQNIVIVDKDKWTVEMVQSATPHALLQAINRQPK